jgi:hypothetical protein
LTLIPDCENSGNSPSCGIFNVFQYNCKWKAIVFGSLLLCKIQLVPLVPLVLVSSFHKIDANQIVSMIIDLYRC